MIVDHIFPYRIQDYVRYRYVKEWHFRILPEPAFRALERLFGWHLCLTGVYRGSEDGADAPGPAAEVRS